MKATHMGNLINDYIKQNGINASHLARKILFKKKLMTYRTLLNKLRSPYLTIDEVISFSNALNHDFLKDIPEYRSEKLPEKKEEASKILICLEKIERRLEKIEKLLRPLPQ